MERDSLQRIFGALTRGEVRYLVAGGLAVLAHGVLRLTQDVDLILALSAANLRRAVDVLTGLGFRPVAPVAFEDFLRPELRQAWQRDKGAVVLRLVSDAHPAVPVDLFLEAPLDFDAAWQRALREEIAPGLRVSFLGLEDLIALKETSDRPQDRLDVDQLRRLVGG